MKRVSFDFDSTLNLPVVQAYAKELIDKGVEVWICTARFDTDEAEKRFNRKGWNKDLYTIAEELGIPEDRIIFTNMELKADVIGTDNGFLWHLDDCTLEVNELLEVGEVTPILRFIENDWESQCNAILNRADLYGEKILLWLDDDDARDPYKVESPWIAKYAPEYFGSKNSIVWVKNYDEFTDWITKYGLPDKVSFDHDLADSHYAPEEFWDDKYDDWLASQGDIEKTGMDCAKWLTEYCMDNKKELPIFTVHSANPAGAKNIQGILTSYLKVQS